MRTKEPEKAREDSLLLTCPEFAAALNVKPCTVRAWTHQRRIPFVKLPGSRAVRYRRADLEKIVKAGLRPALRPLHTPEDPRDGENRGGR